MPDEAGCPVRRYQPFSLAQWVAVTGHKPSLANGRFQAFQDARARPINRLAQSNPLECARRCRQAKHVRLDPIAEMKA